MKFLKAYIRGWSSVFRYKRMILLWYLLNFVLALLSAIPVAGFLGESVGNSLALERSVPGFDYTFWGEMYQQFGDRINAILDQTIWFIVLYFLLSIFLMGGTITVFKEQTERFDTNVFWEGNLNYFWRLTRLTIYFLAVQAFVLLLFVGLLSALNNGLNPFAMESEAILIDTLTFLGPIYVFCITIIFLVQDYAKIDLVHEEPQWLFSIFWGSFKEVFKNFGRFLSLFILNLLTLGLISLVYWLVTDSIVPDTTNRIILLFFFGQIFILFRIAIKLLNLASLTHLYQWTRGDVDA